MNQPKMHSVLLVIAIALPASAMPVLGAGHSFDHSDWATVLETFVDERGRVLYNALAKNRDMFDRYVQRIQHISPDSDPSLFANRNEELAYWINAYNAQVFLGVLDWGTDIDSVWSGLISGRNFFMKRKITLGNKKMSLKAFEDKIVRERYQDPRIHAALNCASIGCPRLPQTPFFGESLNRQLDAAMREFVSSEQNVLVNASEQKAELSKIFNWFEHDFTSYEKRNGGKGSVLSYINRYRAKDAQIPLDFKVSFIPYDKALNRQ